jgi:hypothetical protein
MVPWLFVGARPHGTVGGIARPIFQKAGLVINRTLAIALLAVIQGIIELLRSAPRSI